MSGTLTLTPSLRFSGSRHRPMPRIVSLASAVPAVRRPPASLYEVLRVKQTASPVEIKTAYRAMAKRFHPDVAGSTGGPDFMEIHRAYSTLTDPDAKAQYDLSIRRFRFAGEARLRTRRWETDQCW